MDPNQPSVRLPEKRLRFSKSVVAFSLFMIGAGLALMFCHRRFGPMTGAVCIGAGFVCFFTAGYYWACENETCS